MASVAVIVNFGPEAFGALRHSGRDAGIQRPWMAICGLLRTLNQAFAQSSNYRPWPGFRRPCRNDGIAAGFPLVPTRRVGMPLGRAAPCYGPQRGRTGFPRSAWEPDEAQRRAGVSGMARAGNACSPLVPTRRVGMPLGCAAPCYGPQRGRTGFPCSAWEPDENGCIVCPRGTGPGGGQAKRRLPTLRNFASKSAPGGIVRHPCRNDGTPAGLAYAIGNGGSNRGDEGSCISNDGYNGSNRASGRSIGASGRSDGACGRSNGASGRSDGACGRSNGAFGRSDGASGGSNGACGRSNGAYGRSWVGWANGFIVCPPKSCRIGGQAKRRLPTLHLAPKLPLGSEIGARP